jgi:TPP-dependent pyruvate/acetoin dehydrogenase alpha subunit
MTTTTIEPSAPELAGHQGFSIISNEKLRELYLSMVKCRLLAERLRAGQNQLDAAVGHEAAAVGVLAGLLAEDALVAPPGNLIDRFLHNEIQGKPLDELMTSDARPDLATQLKLTLRAPLARKPVGNRKITVAFSVGDSGFSETPLRRASAKRLPIIFVCQTGVLSPSFGAPECGVPVIPVDGSDVVAVYRVATESITHARKGNGPTLIECFFDSSEAHDPILKMEDYLTRKGLFRKKWKLEELANFTRQLDAAIHAAKA